MRRHASQSLDRRFDVGNESEVGSMRSLALAWGIALLLLGSASVARAGFFDEVLGGLFGPPKVEMREAYERKPGGPSFDHSIYDALLKKYVHAGGWVDYDGLRGERAQLKQYIAALGAAPFDALGRDEKLALLLDAYNAFTLELILEHQPLDSIKDIPAAQRWSDVRWQVGGHTWSLEQIEHRQIRSKFVEPRVHFALVCAAIGCPPLRREAYVAPRLDAQLDDQAQYVHQHERWFRFEPDASRLHLTRLYDWYGGDFSQVAGSPLRFAAGYSPELERALQAGRKPAIEWLQYDWRLNSVANRTPAH
jgi:Protein of unknown function, DUF547